MKNATAMPDLSRLSDAQLENLENFCVCKGRDELCEAVYNEMLDRPHVAPSSYSLQEVLESMGWGGWAGPSEA